MRLSTRIAVCLLVVFHVALVSAVVYADALDEAVARNREVGVLFSSGDIQGARIRGESVVAENQIALGANHPELARSLYQLAVINMQLGRYDEAGRLHLEALAIREAALSPGDLAIADSVMALGGMYRNRGWYAEAEPYLTRGLALREASPVPHPGSL